MEQKEQVSNSAQIAQNGLLADALSNDVNWLKVNECWGKTHHIEKVWGTTVEMSSLKDNQSVCWGDGETYHFRLTEKRIG